MYPLLVFSLWPVVMEPFPMKKPLCLTNYILNLILNTSIQMKTFWYLSLKDTHPEKHTHDALTTFKEISDALM